MKKCNVKHYLLSSLLTITTLLNISPVHGMERDSTCDLERCMRRNAQAKKVEEAKEYNKNHKLINEDLLKTIFSYCINNERESTTHLEFLYKTLTSNSSEKKAYRQIKTLLALHTTCQFFNKLMPFTKIIEFCKTLDSHIKNQMLEHLVSTIYQSYHHGVYQEYRDDNRICSALIHAGADANINYGERPLFFYAKSIEMVEEFIKRSYKIHTKVCKTVKRFEPGHGEPVEECNILSHVVNKEYPADLMKFYIENKVVPQRDILHDLVHALKGHCDNMDLMNEFLKKCQWLLARLYNDDDIKNYLSWDNLSPLDRLVSSNVKAGCWPGFQEKIIKIFIEHGCHVVTPVVKNHYKATAPHKALIDDTEFNKLVDKAKQPDSLMELVKKNDTEQVLKLINAGHVNLNEQGSDGNTLLMIAIMKKNKEMIKHLLDYGADTELSNNIGLTALDIAMDQGNDDLATLLIDAAQANQG